MHDILVPLAFITASISVLHSTLALLFAFHPLAGVCCTTGILVSAIPVHEIVLPIAFILLITHVLSVNAREGDLSLPMLDFNTIVHLPVAYIESAIDVFETPET